MKEDKRKLQNWQFKQRQLLPLKAKEILTSNRIQEWYEHFDGKIYVSFSGGKDSTILLHLARKLYPNVTAVFINTGLEYPEIRAFVKTIENVVWLKPKMPFPEVIEKYGYPIISKEQSHYIWKYRTTKSEKVKYQMWYGNKNGNFKISEKWKFLVNAPFRISEVCCDKLKKGPIKEFEKKYSLYPIIGMRADESRLRLIEYLENGCNAFNKTRPLSNPIAFWTRQDILQYIAKYSIPYADIYGKIIQINNNEYVNTGIQSTGCMFCMFGVHMDKEPNRFQQMKATYPKQYDYCINKLGIGKCLDYIGVKY